MGDAELCELLNFSCHLVRVARNIMLLGMAKNLLRVFRDAHRRQIGQFDLLHIAAYLLAMPPQHVLFMLIFLNSTGIEVPPVGILRDNSQVSLLAATANE